MGDRQPADTYSGRGATTPREQKAFEGFLKHIRNTWTSGLGSPMKGLTLFANVVQIGDEAIALAADGVGTKALVAQMVGKYDTIGIDCVAMNVNDLLCVGAEPVAMLDYLAIEQANAKMLEELGKGLAEGARRARITIPGGETAQLRDMLRGTAQGTGFDLAGMALGRIGPRGIVSGANVEPGDVLVGIESSGIHCNGLTKARNVLFGEMGLDPNTPVGDLSGSVGEELLKPTHIYVPEVLELLKSNDLTVKALANITGDGFLNLTRTDSNTGFVIENLPSAPAIFRVIKEAAKNPITDAEMFLIFNMGVGFCVVTPPSDEQKAIEIIAEHGRKRAFVLGKAFDDSRKRVLLTEANLIGEAGKEFRPAHQGEIESILTRS